MPLPRLAREKSLFFLPKLPKNSFFFAKLLIYPQNRCFSSKKSWTERFSPFQRALPPCLYTKLAVCYQKSWLLLSFGTSGPSKTKISHALMGYFFGEVWMATFFPVGGPNTSKKYLHKAKSIKKVLVTSARSARAYSALSVS